MSCNFISRVKQKLNRIKKPETIVLGMGIISVIIMVSGYILVHASWIALLILVIAELLGHTYPIFSLTTISLIGTPFLMIILGLLTVIVGIFFLVIAELLDIKLEKNNKQKK